MSTVMWHLMLRQANAGMTTLPHTLVATHDLDEPGAVYVDAALCAAAGPIFGLKLSVKPSVAGVDVVVSGYQECMGYIPMLELPVNHLGYVVGKPHYPTPLRSTKSGLLLLGRPYDTEPTT